MANEKRLIYREDLIAEYDRVHIGPPGGARKLMEDAVAVDAVEVVHGRWKAYPDFRRIICTNCLMEFSLIHMPYTRNYCPNCGAKMDLNEIPKTCAVNDIV